MSQEVATLGMSFFVLGFALGPLLWVSSVQDEHHNSGIC